MRTKLLLYNLLVSIVFAVSCVLVAVYHDVDLIRLEGKYGTVAMRFLGLLLIVGLIWVRAWISWKDGELRACRSLIGLLGALLLFPLFVSVIERLANADLYRHLFPLRWVAPHLLILYVAASHLGFALLGEREEEFFFRDR